MQRAAIARSLIASPQLLLADEPTGNLDQQTGAEIMTLLRNLNRQQKLTIVMVTHDNAIAAMADRTVRLTEGLVERLA
jgi:lipoprotein-releasing system ATP-binding protein